MFMKERRNTWYIFIIEEAFENRLPICFRTSTGIGTKSYEVHSVHLQIAILAPKSLSFFPNSLGLVLWKHRNGNTNQQYLEFCIPREESKLRTIYAFDLSQKEEHHNICGRLLVLILIIRSKSN